MRRYKARVERSDITDFPFFDCYAETRDEARAKIAVMQGDRLVRIVNMRAMPVPKYATPCPDCGIPDADVYMVLDELWLAVNGSYEGQLCVECFERRLGRNLTMADLKKDPPCNALFFIKRPRIFYATGC